jgi:hypothetical protein
MSYFVEMKYINLVGARLEKFSWKRNNVAVCRCPICGDSKKNKNKTRFFFFEEKGKFFVKCHNCSYSTTFPKFLEQTGGVLYEDYRMETIKEKFTSGTTANYKEITKIVASNKPVFNVKNDLLCCTKIVDLPQDHHARKYIAGRLIPEKYWNILYYTENFHEAASKNLHESCGPRDERIVIPFYTSDNKLFAMQGRALDPNAVSRYITIRDSEQDVAKIYGMERFDDSKKNYCFEGPIDSLFIDNSVALAGSSIAFDKMPFDTSNTVFVYDNEPRNAEIVERIKETIDAGLKVCIWPETIAFKDVNDMHMGLLSIEHIQEIIDNNTHQGLAAHLKLSKWKRV